MERGIEKLMTDSRVIEDARKDWQEVFIFFRETVLYSFGYRFRKYFQVIQH